MKEKSNEKSVEQKNPKEQDTQYFPRIFRGWFSENRMSKWALGFIIEAVLIVFSVLLALAVNEWRADAAREEKAKIALEAIHTELVENKKEFLESLSYHEEIMDTLGYYQDEGIEPPMSLLNQGIFNPALVFGTAWETAKQSGITDGLNYNLLLELSSHYQQLYRYKNLSDAIINGSYLSSTFEKSPQQILQGNYENWIFLLRDFTGRESRQAANIDTVLAELEATIKK